MKGTSGWALFDWQYHSFINIEVLFLCRGNLRGVIHKYVKY